jgi:hypothetical protein
MRRKNDRHALGNIEKSLKHVGENLLVGDVSRPVEGQDRVRLYSLSIRELQVLQDCRFLRLRPMAK